MIFIFIAHRGNDDHKYPENSILGLLYSLNKDYISGIELDIRITLDNKFVLNHNATHDFKVIKNTKQKDLKLVTLEDLLKKIKSSKIIMIEIKDDDISVVKKLYKVIRKYKLNYYIFSFNYNVVKIFKETYPRYNVGLLVTKVINSSKNISIFDFIAYKTNAYKKIDKQTFIWTINEEQDFLKYNKKNVFIITDKSYLWYNLTKGEVYVKDKING